MIRRAVGIWEIFRDAASGWVNDKASQLGAALAFYSILSLAPLLVISIWVASWFSDQKTARSELMGQLQGMVGDEGASAVQAMLENANQPAVGTLAGTLGIITLLLGASGVFGQLQDSMNTIWKVAPPTGVSIWSMVRARFLSFAMVLGTGFLLLVSLILSALVAGVGRYFGSLFPGLEPLLHLANAAITFVMVTFLFAMIYRLLPDTNVAWRDVWLGALVTADVYRGQISHRSLSGKEWPRLHLRRGWVACRAGCLDLLFGANPLLRRRIDARLFGQANGHSLKLTDYRRSKTSLESASGEPWMANSNWLSLLGVTLATSTPCDPPSRTSELLVATS